MSHSIAPDPLLGSCSVASKAAAAVAAVANGKQKNLSVARRVKCINIYLIMLIFMQGIFRGIQSRPMECADRDQTANRRRVNAVHCSGRGNGGGWESRKNFQINKKHKQFVSYRKRLWISWRDSSWRGFFFSVFRLAFN